MGMDYTVRGVPKKLDATLRRWAEEQGLSLNQAILLLLARGLGLAGSKPEYHDLDDQAGTSVDDAEFEKMLAELDKIDPDLWL
jgi:hypothetical protein